MAVVWGCDGLIAFNEVPFNEQSEPMGLEMGIISIDGFA